MNKETWDKLSVERIVAELGRASADGESFYTITPHDLTRLRRSERGCLLSNGVYGPIMFDVRLHVTTKVPTGRINRPCVQQATITEYVYQPCYLYTVPE